MEKINVSRLEPEFDWDAIVVGDYRLDHSQNFFVIVEKTRHFSIPVPAAAANKENRTINIDRYASTPLAKLSLRNGDDPIKKPIISISKNEMQIITIENKPIDDTESEIITIEQESITNTVLNEEEIMTGKKMEEPMGETPCETQSEPQQESLESAEHTQLSDSLDKSPESEPAQAKLRLEWSTMQPAQSLIPAAAAAQPKAYGFKDVYQSKRDLAMRQREEEERKAREFHSRPMPNFKALHKRLEDVQVVHFITVPKTPDTLKHWYADVERQKQKEQLQREQEKKTEQPRRLALQQPRSQPPSEVDVIKKTHLPSGLRHEIKPFNLRCEQRSRERREYDASVQSAHQQKKKEQEEQRKQRELEEIKKIRKMTEFKARPNPFK